MIRLAYTVLAMFALPIVALAQGPEGYFVTIDDKTDTPRGLVELKLDENGELFGLLRGSFDSTADFSGLCNTCSDDLHNRPISGLRFVWGLERDGNRKFKKGRIMDPESGDTYKSKVKFADDFDSLELRGYIGSPILGRTQHWRRATDEDIAAVNANLTRYGVAPVE